MHFRITTKETTPIFSFIIIMTQQLLDKLQLSVSPIAVCLLNLRRHSKLFVFSSWNTQSEHAQDLSTSNLTLYAEDK